MFLESKKIIVVNTEFSAFLFLGESYELIRFFTETFNMKIENVWISNASDVINCKDIIKITFEIVSSRRSLMSKKEP